MRSEAIKQFVSHHIRGEINYQPLAGDASFRRYIRIVAQEKTYMLMDAPPDKEPVTPFVAVADFLYAAGFSAPQIIARDESQGFLLLEDLGDGSFSRLLREKNADEMILYKAAIEMLAAWHSTALDTSKLALPYYNDAVLKRELRLFSDWFLPQYLDGNALLEAQTSFMVVWESILASHSLRTDCFVHRDFHADNLMWLPARNAHKKIGLLDFQDALYGDPAYDLVSLLEDARRDVALEHVQQLKQHYLACCAVDKHAFEASYALLGAQRNCKIIGIFTRLAARDGKAHYLDFLPRVWRHVEHDIHHPLLAPLYDWFARYVPHNKRDVITIGKNAHALGLAS